MFRRTDSQVPPDIEFKPDLEKLGLERNYYGQYRTVEAPYDFYQFEKYANGDVNEKRYEAVHKAVREDVHKKLRKLGLQNIYVTGKDKWSGTEPNKEVPRIKVLFDTNVKGSKDIYLIVGNSKQELGIFDRKTLMTAGGQWKGSAVGLATSVSYQKDFGAPPKVMILNPGELLHSHEAGESMSSSAWQQKTRPHGFSEPFAVHKTNRVKGHETPELHVASIFDRIQEIIICNDFQRIHIIAIGDGGEGVLRWLDQKFTAEPQSVFPRRLACVALVQSNHNADVVKNVTLIDHLAKYGRAWESSQQPKNTRLASVAPESHEPQNTTAEHTVQKQLDQGQDKGEEKEEQEPEPTSKADLKEPENASEDQASASALVPPELAAFPSPPKAGRSNAERLAELNRFRDGSDEETDSRPSPPPAPRPQPRLLQPVVPLPPQMAPLDPGPFDQWTVVRREPRRHTLASSEHSRLPGSSMPIQNVRALLHQVVPFQHVAPAEQPALSKEPSYLEFRKQEVAAVHGRPRAKSSISEGIKNARQAAENPDTDSQSPRRLPPLISDKHPALATPGLTMKTIEQFRKEEKEEREHEEKEARKAKEFSEAMQRIEANELENAVARSLAAVSNPSGRPPSPYTISSNFIDSHVLTADQIKKYDAMKERELQDATEAAEKNAREAAREAARESAMVSAESGMQIATVSANPSPVSSPVPMESAVIFAEGDLQIAPVPAEPTPASSPVSSSDDSGNDSTSDPNQAYPYYEAPRLCDLYSAGVEDVLEAIFPAVQDDVLKFIKDEIIKDEIIKDEIELQRALVSLDSATEVLKQEQVIAGYADTESEVGEGSEVEMEWEEDDGMY